MILQPGGLSGRPLLFGEVLFDEFMDGETVLGGAPFNVAWHLRGFGLDPLLVSRVGTDRLADRILARMEERGLDPAALQRDPTYPTGRVRVSVVDDEPLFSILPDQAYDHIAASDLPEVDPEHYSLLYHGSLAARNPVSAEALAVLRSSGLPVFVDINLRPPWWEMAQVDRLLAGSRWLKLNHEELGELVSLPTDDEEGLIGGAQSLASRHGLQTVIVTRGAEGVVAVTSDGSVSCPPLPVAGLVDTVGAGDAFSAVSILGITRGWSLETTLARATGFAAAICCIRGAIPEDENFYREYLEAWKR
ncbi:MAG: carbohydrate kinase [Gammaproteobacteria bacterium]